MYLKNLTVLGFKSFADKTSLNFQPGITAIVGPNGCGKSNVADAIRWVLGEQSAKALRGGEMADVIFTGTDHRKALGMAEVSLTIGDVDDEHLKAAGVELAFNEVTVTRRVFRDGGSEYFINRTPCRLKDIQQLFMGTGVGRTSYSIMAQGNITQIISSKPEDRRMVFEEAAGITRFKAQKKEALRKLESTEQNLLRVQDLIREVKRQIGSLQRQAGKARRYKQLMVELQHLDTQLARHHFDVLQAEISERVTRLDRLRAEAETCTETVHRGETEISQLRGLLSELEQQVHGAQQQAHELKSNVERHEGRISFNEERIRELDSQNTKALTDINQAEERRLAAEQELASVTERLTASTSSLAEQRLSLQAKREDVVAIEKELASLQDSLRKAQTDAFSAAQQATRVRNEITALDLQKQGNVVRLEKLSAEKIQLEEERLRLDSRLSEFAASVETEKQNVLASRGTVEERQARLRELQQELDRTGRELDSALREQAEKRSRLNVLDQLQHDYEGFSAGALAALKGARHVLGSLADRIRVPDEYITAVEAALGIHLQIVLAEHPEAAQEILSDLSIRKKGRASIAALSLRNAEPACVNGNGVNGNGDSHASAATMNGHDGQNGNGAVLAKANGQHEACAVAVEAETPSRLAGDASRFQNGANGTHSSNGSNGHSTGHSAVPETVGKLTLSVIESDATVQPLLSALLGNTVIVPDLTAATLAWRETDGQFDFVTLTGELLNRYGVYTGGSSNGNGKSSASMLVRKNQIAELRTALADLQGRITEVSRQKGALQSEQTALLASLQEAQSELRTQEVAIATHEGEFRALQNSLRSLHQKIETVIYEIQSLAAQEREGMRKRDVLAAQLSDLETRERALQQQLADANTGLDALRSDRDRANASLTETKVTLASEEQLNASFGHQQNVLQNRVRELAQLISQRRGECASFVHRREQFTSEIDDSRRRIDALQHEREQVNNRLAELFGQKESQEADISAREETLRVERRRLGEVQQQRSAVEIELAQKNMSVQNLRQRILEKYQINLDDLRSECIKITYADEGPARVEVITPDDMVAAGVSTDWNAVSEQVAALQKRIDEMGPVNLVAIEEYEETEQRYQFLTTQNDDLVKAKEQLLDVINRINAQTREMFTDTFNKIRDNFRAMFTEIFGGGKADLQLVDEGDVLESGIEIVARPPGKQLQSISLLSGGEQTMTAVALLFSIYQVKPSPFCVLDELDAPLDESNINRFIRILQRFLAHSQFLIITHNKRTIGMADVLYGVTMEEHGVSKIVSVRFHKVEEAPSGQTQLPLVPPSSATSVDAEEDQLRSRPDTIEVSMAN